MIREEDTRFIAAHIPHAELKILPGESHGSYVHDSDKIARLLLPFLGNRIIDRLQKYFNR